MKIRALLWVIFLVRFCGACCILQCLWEKITGKPCCNNSYCDDDDDVYVQVAQGSSNELSTEPQNVPFLPGVIDIAALDKEQFQSFYYSFAVNLIKLIVPKKNVSVSKLMDSLENVCTLSSEETLDHAKLYLNKDGKAELVLVVTKASGSVKEHYLELKNGKWVSCDDHDAKIKSLKDTTEWKSDFEIDISSVTSTKECTVFEAELLGVTTKHFYPVPSQIVIGVKDGGKFLWSSPKTATRGLKSMGSNGTFNGYSDYCSYCIIRERGSIEVLEMVVVENSSERSKYFEKVGNEWKELKRDEFDKKLDDMKREPDALGNDEVHSETLHPVGVSTDDHASVSPQASPEEPHDDKRTPHEPEEGTLAKPVHDGDSQESHGLVEESKHTRHSEEVPAEVARVTTENISSSEHMVLDISSPDDKRITICTKTAGDIQHKDYYVKTSFYASSVVDGELSIWNGEGRCLYVETSSRNGDMVLSLCTFLNGEIDFKHFYKTNGTWKEITQEVLSQRYQNMRKGAGQTLPEGESYS